MDCGIRFRTLVKPQNLIIVARLGSNRFLFHLQSIGTDVFVNEMALQPAKVEL
jgi:hypothetical protein